MRPMAQEHDKMVNIALWQRAQCDGRNPCTPTTNRLRSRCMHTRRNIVIRMPAVQTTAKC
jgi:hypothetical protein